MAKPKSKQPAPGAPAAPPRVPPTLEELDAAIALLGSRCRVELGSDARARLEQLVGRYPSAELAASWKSTLKRLRNDESAWMAFVKETAASHPDEAEPPPVVPTSRAELAAAIELLGHRIENELGPETRARLEQLVGGYPSAELAAHWKITLKRLRDDEPELFD